MLIKFWHLLHKWGGVLCPSMRVCGSAMIPLVFHPDNCTRNVNVKEVCKIPYGVITGASVSRAHKRIFDFCPGKGFKPEPCASRVPFTGKSVDGPASTLADHFCILTVLTPNGGPDRSTPTPVLPVASSPSVELLFVDHDSTLQWGFRLTKDRPS